MSISHRFITEELAVVGLLVNDLLEVVMGGSLDVFIPRVDIQVGVVKPLQPSC